MTTELTILVLLVGLAILLSALIKNALGHFDLPAIPGYILLGFGIRALDAHIDFLPEQADSTIEFLAQIGVVTLLFHIGTESKLKKLLQQFGRAFLIGMVSIVASGALGFVGAFWILGQSLLTSLFVGSAMVATSVGVAVGVWEEAGAINTRNGQLLLDVAEFDDIVGVILMALLFAAAPALAGRQGHALLPTLLATGAAVAGKLVLFGAICVAFAHYVEKTVTGFLRRFEKPPEETLTVIAMGLAIAAVAGLLGFSVAIGAFFAGLIFSRDPESLKSRTAFTVIYECFTPFFFIGIGLDMRVGSLGAALVPALLLTAVAFAGKFVGAMVPALILQGRRPSVLLGLSMIPRAEVAMIISQRGLTLEGEAMRDHIYSALVFTCLASCLIPPVLLRRLIRRWAL